jgi:hypothetical protein
MASDEELKRMKDSAFWEKRSKLWGGLMEKIVNNRF